jgi:glyoxylase-like metal-dependent hydrolase (beta-lactamase superfamily II)
VGGIESAVLPLPGGAAGATVRVHPMRTGEIKAPAHFLQRPAGPLPTLRGLGLLSRRSRWGAVPVPAFAVEHPGAGLLLVDTGLHPAIPDDPVEGLGRVGARALAVTMRPEWAVPAQLRGRGLEPGDVRTVVMTHLHYDHTGAASEFPQAAFVVDRAEWASAHSSGLRKGYRRAHLDHPLDWRLLDFTAADVGSYETFGRALDLLGDGSIRLVSTPGHSRGHLSVLLRLAGGRELLLTGDAAYARRSIDEGLLPTLCEDVHRYRRSLAELRRYVERNPDIDVICGHDAECWPAVRDHYA